MSALLRRRFSALSQEKLPPSSSTKAQAPDHEVDQAFRVAGVSNLANSDTVGRWAGRVDLVQPRRHARDELDLVEPPRAEAEEWRDLPRVVAATPVEETVQVVVIRDGKRKNLRVEIGALEEPNLARGDSSRQTPGVYGLRAQDLTPELASQLGIDEADGVVVTDVRPGSPASEAGLQRGDVIIEVDRDQVKDTADLQAKLESDDDSVLMLIRRGDSTLYMPMKPAG